MSTRTKGRRQPDEMHPATPAPSSRVEIAIWILVILVSIVWPLTQFSRVAVDPDELEHLHMAWLWNQDVQPYTGFFDDHPPLYWLLLRPLVGGGNRDLTALVTSARVVAWSLLVLSVGAAFWLFARLLGRGPAIYGAGLWAIVCAYDIRSVHVRPDMLMIFFLLAGMALAVEGMGLAVGRGGSRRRAMLGGILLAVAVCVLPKAVFWLLSMLAVAIACAVYSAAHSGDRSKLAPLGMLAGGMAIAAGVQVGWIAAFNDFARYWFCNVTANGHLASTMLKNPTALKWALTFAFSGWPMASMLLALIGAAALATQKEQGAAFRKLLLAGLAASGLLLVVMGTGPWLQYQFCLLVVVSGLGGMGLTWSYRRFSPRAKQFLAAAVLAMAVVWPWVNYPTTGAWRGNVGLKESLIPFQYMLDHARPGDTCAVLVNANPVMMMDADPQQCGRLMCFQGADGLRSVVASITEKQPRWIVGVDASWAAAPEAGPIFSSLWVPTIGLRRIQLVRRPNGSIWLGAPGLGYVSADDLWRLYEPQQVILLERLDKLPN